jgi:proline iminopeptidase
MGRLAVVADTRLYAGERGARPGFPLLVFHGGPGLDHTEFGDHLDTLTEGGRYRLVLADERRAAGRAGPRRRWTLARMARDVSDLAASLGVRHGYATLGHSYGAFVVLQHAVDHPGEPRGTIVSSGIAAARWLAGVGQQLAAFEPAGLRAQVISSWAAERQVQTEEQAAALAEDQLPFHFLQPRGAALAEYRRRTAGRARYAPEVIRSFAAADYGGIDVEDRLMYRWAAMSALDWPCPTAAATWRSRSVSSLTDFCAAGDRHGDLGAAGVFACIGQGFSHDPVGIAGEHSRRCLGRVDLHV